MKKILILLFLTALVCTSVFSVDVSLNLGGGAVFNKGKFYLTEAQKIEGYPKEYKSTLVDIDLGLEVGFDNNLVVYDTISVGFLADEIKIKTCGEDKDFFAHKLDNSFLISESIGAAYKFRFGDFALLTGAGVKADIFEYRYKENDAKMILKMRNFGAGLNLKGSYFFNESFAAMFAVRPSVSFYDSWSRNEENVTVTETKSDGASTGLSCTAVFGIEYKF